MTAMRLDLDHGDTGHHLTVDDDALAGLTPGQIADLEQLVAQALDDLTALGVTDPHAYLLAQIGQIHADTAAYEREATRRGTQP